MNKTAHDFDKQAFDGLMIKRFFFAPAFEIYGGKLSFLHLKRFTRIEGEGEEEDLFPSSRLLELNSSVLPSFFLLVVGPPILTRPSSLPPKVSLDCTTTDLPDLLSKPTFSPSGGSTSSSRRTCSNSTPPS